jgi:hypothetical protein
MGPFARSLKENGRPCEVPLSHLANAPANPTVAARDALLQPRSEFRATPCEPPGWDLSARHPPCLPHSLLFLARPLVQKGVLEPFGVLILPDALGNLRRIGPGYGCPKPTSKLIAPCTAVASGNPLTNTTVHGLSSYQSKRRCVHKETVGSAETGRGNFDRTHYQACRSAGHHMESAGHVPPF